MKWDLPLAIANALDNVAVCILLFVMIGDTSLINYNFITKLADLINIPLTKINSIWGISGGIPVVVIVIVIICLWDSISGFIKCKN
jgi:presenilin-like A22 family membrane protease